jgi:hypothetical protein
MIPWVIRALPQLTFTLISIPTLDRIGFRTVLYDGEASVTLNGEVILSGTLKDGLYHLDPFYVEQLGGDTESDTPERAPADEIVMTTLASELKSLESSLQGIAGSASNSPRIRPDFCNGVRRGHESSRGQ